MLVVVDGDGRALRQFNGLASARIPDGGWRPKPIGYLPSDRLRGYDTDDHPHTFLPMRGAGPSSRDLAPALASGAARVLETARDLDAAELGRRIAVVRRVIAWVNARSPGPEGGGGAPYPLLGLGRNSNSFFTSLLRALGEPQPVFRGPQAWAPGAGASLAPEAVLIALAAGADQSADAAAAAMGERKAATSAATRSTPSAVG